MADTKQQRHEQGLVTHFKKRYKEKYKIEPTLNRYTTRWAFRDILMDLEYDEAKALIDYYFGTVSPVGHSVDWFLRNYEKLVEAKVKTDEDAASLARIREETKRRTEEWRKKKSGNN
jgi:hypothetical protein